MGLQVFQQQGSVCAHHASWAAGVIQGYAAAGGTRIVPPARGFQELQLSTGCIWKQQGASIDLCQAAHFLHQESCDLRQAGAAQQLPGGIQQRSLFLYPLFAQSIIQAGALERHAKLASHIGEQRQGALIEIRPGSAGDV